MVAAATGGDEVTVPPGTNDVMEDICEVESVSTGTEGEAVRAEDGEDDDR